MQYQLQLRKAFNLFNKLTPAFIPAINTKQFKNIISYAFLVTGALIFIINCLLVVKSFQALKTASIDLEKTVVSFIFFSLFILIFINTFLNFILQKERNYLIYMWYMLLSFMYFNIANSNTVLLDSYINGASAFIQLMAIPVILVGHMLFLQFWVSYLGLKNRNHALYIHVKVFNGIINLVIYFYLLIVFTADNPSAIQLFEKIIIGIAIILCCWMLVVSFQKIKKLLLKPFILGPSIFTICSLICMLYLYNKPGATGYTFVDFWGFFAGLGLICEFFRYSTSFAYRIKANGIKNNRIIKQMYEEIESQVLQEKELRLLRENISANLHDDIGSSLTNISILNELIKRNMANPEKATTYLTQSADEIQRVSENLNDIVWNVNPTYDNLNTLLYRMKHYAIDMMEGKNIDCNFVFPVEAVMEMDMERRRNFYLIFKEAINNLIKYSYTKFASVSIQVKNNVLTLIIKDEGIGFNQQLVAAGNGLKSMQQRAMEMNAVLNIISAPDKGTMLKLSMAIN